MFAYRIQTGFSAVLLAATLWTTTLAAPPALAGQATPAELPDEKSPDGATLASLLATVAPTAAGIALLADGKTTPLLGLGLYAGPAVGYWTHGVSGRGWAGVGARVGIALGGTALAFAVCSKSDDGWGYACDNGGTVTAILLATTAGIVAHGVRDIARVDEHVRARNEELRRRRSPTLSVAPIVLPTDGGTVGIAGRIGL